MKMQMGFGISNKRMRVVWLCHFANKGMKGYFNTPKVSETAPWINNLINLFQLKSDIELHIVAPNIFINKDTSVQIDNITFHFYQYRINYISKKLLSFIKFDSLTHYFFIQRKIEAIIITINPDIVHLHGAENPYYAAGILNLINRFPTLLTIQGFIRNSSVRNRKVNKMIQLEEQIIKNINHIGVRTNEMTGIVASINSKAQLYYHNYPITIPEFEKNIQSDYDIVYFAKLSKDKGIEDLLYAISLIKKVNPFINLHVIGRTSSSYLQHLKDLINSLGIESNVSIIGFLETQHDVHRHAVKAKICVLPTYHDIIPGTIIESMFMKIPVVAYAVGGIPELNNEIESIVLVDKRNIRQLADKIINLLSDGERMSLLAENAYSCACKRFNNNQVYPDLLSIYKRICSL